MAEEITSLVVAVDSTSAKTAVSDLDRLADAGDRADASVKKLGSDFSNIGFNSSQLQNANRSLNEFRQRMEQVGSATRKTGDEVSKVSLTPNQLFSANAALNQYRKNMESAREAAAAADRDISRYAFGTGNLMRVNRSLREWRQEMQSAAATSAQIAKQNSVVAASHHQVSKAAAGYTKTQKELAFASRNLPAQFTDIAVSLQAGQNPLTVLLQQGGQLKDMFGGIGPAARAMGGYIMGLITPINLLIGAIGATAVAFIQGEQESVRFARSIEMTGNFAGTTIGRLTDLSREMQSATTTQRQAAGALNEVVATGRFAEDQIRMIAQAAIDMNRNGGKAVSDTVEEFTRLRESPVQAVLELNKAMHFLTESTYNQIRSLEEQGDTLGAAQLAMETYADAVEERTANVEESLGSLQRAWRAVADTAKRAWDAMLDIGRAESPAETYNNLATELARLQNPAELMKWSRESGLPIPTPAERTARIAEIRTEMQELLNARVAEQKRLNQETQRRFAEESAIALDQEAAQYASNAEKRNRERLRVQKQADEAYRIAMAQGNEEMARRIREDEAKILEGINKRYADPVDRAGATALRAQQREYESLNERIAQHRTLLAEASNSEEKLSEIQRFAARTISDMENGYTKLNSEQQATIRTQLEELVALDQLNREREKTNRLLEINQRMNERIAGDEARRAAMQARDLRSIGHGRETNVLMDAMDDIRNEAMRDRIELEREYGELNRLNSQEYLDQLARINEAEQRQLANELEHLRRRKAAQADWRNGARSAMEDIQSSMDDVAGRTRDGFLRMYGALESGLDRFVQTGKFKMRDFATTVIAELARIALTIAASRLISSIFGGFTTQGGADLNIGGSTLGTSNVYAGGLAAATGAVLAGGRHLTTYALGGALGGVRTAPMLFPMANGGTGLMAEHRPEAIMPLQRGPDGKLGVAGYGGGGTMINMSTNVTINQDGTASTSTESNVEDGKRLGQMIEAKMRDLLNQERRQGGILWNMANGR